jgi:mannose-1-phosphate guanylyltransferase/mannose-6-phosphate isomerase
MIVVIIAGGSGTRLWPLSTKDYPKHLLKLTNERSLLQNTYDRVKDLSDDIFIVPEKSHVKYVYQQLPEIPRKRILAEPGRRGTASCFLMALSEIKKQGYEDQAVLFLWGDHLVKDRAGFSKSITQFAKIAENKKKLIFMGGEPTYPATGFNYIHVGKPLKGFKKVYELEEFVEKPNKATAEKYFLGGDYLWNSGYLLGTVATFEKEIETNAPKLWANYQRLLNQKLPKAFGFKKLYMSLPNEVIDSALSEKVKDAIVVCTPFDWADVGSFHDLHSVSEQDKTGNHIKGDNIELADVTDSYIRNEADVPVAVIGLSNVAVIATENGVLVTNKEQAQKVGDISKRLQTEDKKAFKWLEKLNIGD